MLFHISERMKGKSLKATTQATGTTFVIWIQSPESSAYSSPLATNVNVLNLFSGTVIRPISLPSFLDGLDHTLKWRGVFRFELQTSGVMTYSTWLGTKHNSFGNGLLSRIQFTVSRTHLMQANLFRALLGLIVYPTFIQGSFTFHLNQRYQCS